MKIKNILFGLGMGLGMTLAATSAIAIPTTVDVDQTFDNWSDSTVSNGQTVSWTFDYSSYGLTAGSVIDSASLSITALGVDAYADPVKVETNLLLGNLTPGNGTTTFDILGITGSYTFLLDGLLTVSVTARELTQYGEYHPYTHRHYYSETHNRHVQHDCWYGFGHCDDIHSYNETHYYNQTHTNYHLHTRADSLELISSNLKITAQDPHTQDPHSVPEPSTLLLLLAGLGVAGFKSRLTKK